MKARPDLIRPEHLRIGPQGPEVFGQAAATLQAFAMIEAAEHGTPRVRRDYQQQRIAEVLEHARGHSPFWAARIGARRPALWRLPLLKRRELRAQVEAEGALPVPPDHGDVIASATSGATSEPLRFFVTRQNGAYNEARYAFDDIASDRDLGIPLTLMHKRFETVENFDRWPNLTGAIWRTGPAVGLPLGLAMDEIAERLLAGGMGHVMIRPNQLAALVAYATATGRRPQDVGDVLTIGETIAPGLRARTRAAFGARIADRYTCEEVGPIAFQCWTLDTHYHVASSNVLLETVDEGGRDIAAGKPGNLLVTGLQAMATPLLRYDIGDIARLLPRCPCGHAGPALTDLRGRRKSLLRLPDGRRRYFHLEASRLLAIAPVREFRVLQTDKRTLVLEAAAERALTTTESEAIAALLRAEVSPDFFVRIDQVESIAWGESGKRITVLNLMDDPPE